MKRRLLVIGWVAGIAGFLGILGFGLAQGSRSGLDRLSEQGAGTPLAGKAAPDFSLEVLDGEGASLSLTRFRGQAVVLNFWASWCAGCRREHPNLMAAFERYRDRGVVFLGVVFQDTPAGARAYMKEFGGGYPGLLDPGSRTAVTYGVYGVPETFFIDPSGVVRYRRVGESSYELLTSRIEQLLRGAE